MFKLKTDKLVSSDLEDVCVKFQKMLHEIQVH